MQYFIHILFLLFLVSIPVVTSAHSGRTDQNGCHYDRFGDTYHCHRTGNNMGNGMGFRTPTDFNAIRAMNPMGVRGALDNQVIEATAREHELANQEKEYGLMSGITQRGMAADVANKEAEIELLRAETLRLQQQLRELEARE